MLSLEPVKLFFIFGTFFPDVDVGIEFARFKLLASETSFSSSSSFCYDYFDYYYIAANLPHKFPLNVPVLVPQQIWLFFKRSVLERLSELVSIE